MWRGGEEVAKRRKTEREEEKHVCNGVSVLSERTRGKTLSKEKKARKRFCKCCPGVYENLLINKYNATL